MARLIVLDAGVVGLLCSSPSLTKVRACRQWSKSQERAGTRFFLSDLTFFEVERELLRIKARAKLARLDDLASSTIPIIVSRAAWRKAAEFWASLRQSGKPTASPDALDGDAILAAVAATVGGPGDEVVIATTNAGHLVRFPGIDARIWEDIP